MAPDPRCILDNPETDCIKNSSELIGHLNSSGPTSTDSTEKSGNAALKYLKSLVVMDKDIIKNDKCGNVLGNKFLYEYGKCKDDTGKIHTRYKYIDATCDGDGWLGGEDKGFIPCTINSAIDVGAAAVGIPSAIFEDAVPLCKEQPVNCKVSNKGESTFDGQTKAYIVENIESFDNLYESINDYMKNNDLDFDNNKNMNSDNKYYNNFKSDSTLNEMYYIMLMIFFLFIIFKLINKR